MSFCLTIEYEGYVDNVPYITQDFDKSKWAEVHFEIFKSMSGLTPLQKLVYLIIDAFSCTEYITDGYRIYVRITIEQIADTLDEDVYDVRIALSELLGMKKISVIKDKEGKSLYLSLLERR